MAADAALSVAKIIFEKVMEAKAQYDALADELDKVAASLELLQELAGDRDKIEAINGSGIQEKLRLELKQLDDLIDEIMEIKVGCCGALKLTAAALAGGGAAMYNQKIAARREALKAVMDVASEQIKVAQLAALEDLAGGVPAKVIVHPGARQFWKSNFGLDRATSVASFAEAIESNYSTDLRRTFQDMRADLRRGLLGQLDPSQDGTIEAVEFGQFVENSGAAYSKNLDFFDIVTRSAVGGSLATAMTVAHCSEIRAVTVYKEFIATADTSGFVKVWMYLDGTVFAQMNSAVGAVQDQVTYLKFAFDPVRSLQIYAASRNIVLLGAFTGANEGLIREPHVSQVTGMDVEGDYCFSYAKYPSKAAHVFRRCEGAGSKEFIKYGNIGGSCDVTMLECVGNGRHVVLLSNLGVVIWDYLRLCVEKKIDVGGASISSIALHVVGEGSAATYYLICAVKKKQRALVIEDPVGAAKVRRKRLAWKNEDYPRSHFTPTTQLATGFGKDSSKIKAFKHDIIATPDLSEAEFDADEKLKADAIEVTGAEVKRLFAGETLGVALLNIKDPKVGVRGGFLVLDFTKPNPEKQVPTILGTMGAWAMHSLPTTETLIAVPWCLAKHHFFPVDNHGTILTTCKSANVHIFGGANNIIGRRSFALEYGRDRLRSGARRKSFAPCAAKSPEEARDEPPLCTTATISAICGIKHDPTVGGDGRGDVDILFGFSDGTIIKHSFTKNEARLNEKDQLVLTDGEDKGQLAVVPKHFSRVHASTWVDECNAESLCAELRAFAMSIVATVRLGDATSTGRTVVKHIEVLYNALQRTSRNLMPRWAKFISQKRDSPLDEDMVLEITDILNDSFDIYVGTEDVTALLQREEEEHAGFRSELRRQASINPDDEKKPPEEQSDAEKEKNAVMAKINAKKHEREQERKWRRILCPLIKEEFDVRYKGKMPFTNLGHANAEAFQFIDPEAWRAPAGLVKIVAGHHKCSDCGATDFDPVEQVWQICKKCAAKRSDPKSCISCAKPLPNPRSRDFALEFEIPEMKLKAGDKATHSCTKWVMCNQCYDREKLKQQQMVLCLAASREKVLAGVVEYEKFRNPEGLGDLVHLSAADLSVKQRLVGVYPQGYRNIASTSGKEGLFAVSLHPATIAIINDTELNMADDFIARIEYGKLIGSEHNARCVSLSKSPISDKALLFFDARPSSIGCYTVHADTHKARRCDFAPLHTPREHGVYLIDVPNRVISSLAYGGRADFPVLAVGCEDGSAVIFGGVETDPTAKVILQLFRCDVISEVFFTPSDLIAACNNGAFSRMPLDIIYKPEKAKEVSSGVVLLEERAPLAAERVDGQATHFTAFDGSWKAALGKKPVDIADDKSNVSPAVVSHLKLCGAEVLTAAQSLSVAKLSCKATLIGAGAAARRGRDLVIVREDRRASLVVASRFYAGPSNDPSDKVENARLRVTDPSDAAKPAPRLVVAFPVKDPARVADGRDLIVRVTPMTVTGDCKLRVKIHGTPDAAALVTSAPIQGMTPLYFEFRGAAMAPELRAALAAMPPNRVQLELSLIHCGAAGSKESDVEVFFHSVINSKATPVEALKLALFVSPPVDTPAAAAFAPAAAVEKLPAPSPPPASPTPTGDHVAAERVALPFMPAPLLPGQPDSTDQ